MSKTKGSIHICAMTLNLIVSCDGFNLVNTFDDYCFKHAHSKVCQYAILDDKVACGLCYALIKYFQLDIEKI
jgi:hypothetical protein